MFTAQRNGSAVLKASLAVLLTSLLAVGGTTTVAAAGQPAELSIEFTGSILINELANGGSDSTSASFFELRNWGAVDVDLTGWHVFRCSEQGLRSNVGRPESDLTGVILRPGQLYTVSKVGLPGDAHFTQPFGATGFGLYLESPDAQLVDGVGVYPNQPWQTQSECTVGNNLANRLNFAAGESWQRVSPTQFVVAPSTLGAQNATSERAPQPSTVVISEVASAGPAAGDDEFIELENTGTKPVNVSGWQLYRCTATGRLTANTHELTIAAGTTIAAGQRFVIGGLGFAGEAHATITHSLADISFGVLLQSASGRLVDRVSVSAHDDSACQNGDDKLAALLDPVANESYQRVGDTFLIAPRTPGGDNATVESAVAGQPVVYGAIAISELATDPNTEGMPAGSVQRNYVELGNYSDSSVDISGYTVRRCQADGLRSRTLQFTVPAGTVLGAGKVYLAAREGTAAASVAAQTYSTSFNFLGTGVWVTDASGRRIDSLGVYAANEMDESNPISSVCTKGTTLTTYLPDRLAAETFQRARFTGSDADDFLVSKATPGLIDRRQWVNPAERVATASTVPTPTSTRDFARGGTKPGEHAGPTEAATTIEAWSGVSGTPLQVLVGENEIALSPTAPGSVADNSFALPYQRFVLDASELTAGSTVGWRGATTGRNELQLSVWNGSWRSLDAGSTQLQGTLETTDIIDGRVTLLVQDGPRTRPTLTTEPDAQLEDPAAYDLAITHITDTQYLAESYPEVYGQLVSWVADNAAPRKIAFATHTGDLVQNWVDPDQSEQRARIEFERASEIQKILDDAGVPNSVLPGNHDSKRGVTYDLYNEYFAPSRYDANEWYGGSIAPGDNTANFSTFTHEGTPFLMLSLPYAYGDREIEWAEEVVSSHADFNVILSTHEHVKPKTLEEQAHRSTNSRWVSRGKDLWDRVVAPNRNVVVVLSGHFHGIGQLVTENAGGIEGHTVVELLADYQEFRTHTGERATGFFRMLQVDLDAGKIAVDTRSVRLAASYSFEYDYRQFLPDNGLVTTPSNARPWRIVEEGVQGRYGTSDDEFTAEVTLLHPKLVSTAAILVSPSHLTVQPERRRIAS